MRQIWKLLWFLWATVFWTTYLAWKTRRMRPCEAARFRAHRQRIGCALLCRILGVDVRLVGELPPGADLAVCNHFGVLDSLVVASRMEIAYVGKADLRSWPFVGWVTRTYGLVFVERGRATATAQFVEEVQEKLACGVRVLVFPEGGTTADLAVGPFKTGAFEAVAGHGDQAVLPLYLTVRSVEGEPAVGAVRDRVVWADPSESFMRHFWRLLGLRRVEMEIRVGERLPVASHDRKALARTAHAAVERLRLAEVEAERY